MKNILYIILLLSATYSQTDVSGVVSGSWTLEGSPYNVVDDVDVITTLDIEPGVEVIFETVHAINIYGMLTANGTVENPIQFRNGDGGGAISQIIFQNSWNGCSLTHIEFIDLHSPVSASGSFTMEVSDISVTNNYYLGFGGRDVSNITVTGKTGTSTILGGSNIDGLTVTDSEGPILQLIGNTVKNAEFIRTSLGSNSNTNHIVNCSGPTNFIDNVSITESICNNTSDGCYAIKGYSNQIYINNLEMKNEAIGALFIDGVCSVNIEQMLLSGNNNNYMIYMNGASNHMHLNHATMFNNNGGIRFQGNPDNISITNSVCYLGGCGGGMGTFSNSYWENLSYSGGNTFDGGGNITDSPMYIDFETLELHPDSPLIDAGTGDDDVCFPPSMGTSTPDIGHTGGPGACDWDDSYEPSNAGCTDPSANNYDPDATYNDGSCEYDVYGCTDPSANNYNPDANIDDGNCTFDCEGSNPEGCLANGCPDGYLCIDDWENNCVASACSCDSDTGGWMCTDDCNGGTCFESTSGCTYPEATNFDPYAIEDDGSCEFDEFEDCEEVFNEGYELGAQSGDLNLDGLSNVLDIVVMVNNILNP